VEKFPLYFNPMHRDKEIPKRLAMPINASHGNTDPTHSTLGYEMTRFWRPGRIG